MIVVVRYRTEWPQEFRQIGRQLRQGLGNLAVRIDHIGSTAVPELAAKDVIDIQVTVRELQRPVEMALTELGYSRLQDILADHIPPGGSPEVEAWAKWVFKPPPAQRATNLHVRVDGRPNQRYPLLFRDYLRADSGAAEAYAQVKRALARMHPNDKDAYYEVKDPVCDIVIAAAEAWAASVGWRPGPSDC